MEDQHHYALTTTSGRSQDNS